MTEASWPFYGAETNETQFSKWARALAPSGISSGLAITPGTGMQVALAAGSALVRGVYYENSDTKLLTVGAAPAAGQTRQDALVLRLDQTANTVTAVVKAGTANSSGGALPSLTQTETTWEMLLGVITVASGSAAVTSGMIFEAEPHAGLRVLPYETAKRPTLTGVEVAIGVDITAKRLELWTGSAWVNLSDFANIAGTLAISAGGTGGTSASQARTNLGAAAAAHSHVKTDITDFPATMPPDAHNHSAANITSGTLAVARGGTGVTGLAALREALDIYVQPSAPGHKAGRVWIPGTELA